MMQSIQTHLVACNLCQSTDTLPLFSAKDRLHGFEGTFHYVQCRSCGLVYMNPQIALESLKSFYPSDYGPYQSGSGTTNNLKKKSRIRLKHRLSKFRHLTLDHNSSVLDVGCGNGNFLGELKKSFGCKVYGVDIAEDAVQTAKRNHGVDVFLGEIADAPFAPHSFDVITAWQYLEHVQNPLDVLRAIHRLLKANGLCVISTPNFNSFNAKIFKNKWYALDCPRHLHLYAAETIKKMLQKTGFSLMGIHYDTSSTNSIKSLQYYLYGNNYSAEHHNKVKKSLVIKAVLSVLSRVAALLKRSDNMVVYAKKI